MSGTAAPERVVPARLPRVGYIPALDGLRALAVVAVILYHGGVDWMPGGFLGVDVFFVISGYLITSLLLRDWREEGRIRFGRFYLRRARRLLPALFLMLVVVALYAILFLPDTVSQLRGQTIAAIFYVENWYLIYEKVSYFIAVGRPSMLQHVWSLAVEEQFYLIWPLVFSFLLARWGKQRDRLVAVVIAMAIASALLMAVLYKPYTDPSRVYFGTDTRASTMLIGTALAIVWTPWRLTRRTGRTAPLALDLMAFVGFAGVLWFFLNAGEFDNWMYRGGFVLVALFSALLIAATVHPAARLSAAVFGQRVFVWVGVRSYSIYLWHWPIFVITRPHADVPFTGVPLLVFRTALTFVFATLSYRYVEQPFRSGAVGRWLAELRSARGARRQELGRRFGILAGSSVAAVLVIGAGFASAGPAPRPEGAPDVEAVALRPIASSLSGVTDPTSTPPEATTTTVGIPSFLPGHVTAIGDSVMLGAATTLQQTLGPERTYIFAEVSLQFGAGVDRIQQLRAAGELGEEVVVQLGNNGTVDPDDFARMLESLRDAKKVVVLNVRVPRPWEGQVNEVLAEGVKRYRNAVLVDWNAAGNAHPEFFWDDGIHLRPEGAQFYARLVAEQVSPPLAVAP